MKKTVVIISAHPDDETLGAGGTLLKHKSQGDNLYWIIGTQMKKSKQFTEERIILREKEIEKVSKIFGFKRVYQLKYETATLDSNSLTKIIPQISIIFSEIKPNIIYNLNIKDAHSDHRILSEAVFSNTKSFRHPYIQKVLMYECISETEFAPQIDDNLFLPNYFVDISNHIDQKIDTMKIYKSELGDHPFPRSIINIRSLSIIRGAMINVKHAEAFQAVKIIS